MLAYDIITDVTKNNIIVPIVNKLQFLTNCEMYTLIFYNLDKLEFLTKSEIFSLH